MPDLSDLRDEIRRLTLADEKSMLDRLIHRFGPDETVRRAAEARATKLVDDIRTDAAPGLMEVFLAEYGLSTDEGIALMCLAEALLRVPDAETIDALIEDKIAPSAWGEHLGHSSSSLVNASTWALMLTGKVLQEGEGVAAILRAAVRRLGEPVIRAAVSQAMKEMGRQFVLGETIASAIARGRSMVEQGYTFSYDMLGEAALTSADADRYFAAYASAIRTLAGECRSADIRANPGISIKLSAIHPRYETLQAHRVREELAPRLLALAKQARDAGMGLNIDAEEADRLDLSLDLVETVMSDPSLANWEGFGVVVQAYGKRASAVIDWLHALAERHDRRLMVRLVKGAYWDTEIKHAQVEGLAGFPVFTRKAASDVSFVCCARQLLGLADRIYPQFATHNAHSVSAILESAPEVTAYEFQRLHGMGEVLHRIVKDTAGTRCRIYAPVGAHRDLLAYLVRRLLENGANSSFVNQIVDSEVPASKIAADPFSAPELSRANPAVIEPQALFGASRRNSRGTNLQDPVELAAFLEAREPFAAASWRAGPLIAGPMTEAEAVAVVNPARPDDIVGHVTQATPADAETAIAAAQTWGASAAERAETLRRAADLYEANAGELHAMLAREAGKCAADCVNELREAVDFLRYYAAGAETLARPPRGVIACISPWNFPLAIFTGQIAAALAGGNAVLAKPAEATPLVAHRAVRLLHEAGVPGEVLQFLPGEGPVIGARLAGAARLAGMCFTGSTATAQAINRAMARGASPRAPLIAETGGLNAMIVDSTALPEQAVRDIVTSAFRSAGQRCSALRILYVQKDVAERIESMLLGAMDELALGDPWDPATDVGPLIDRRAQQAIRAYVENARSEGRLVRQMRVPSTGHFLGPAVIRVAGIGDLEREIFGPVLHIATFAAEDLGGVVDAINASGYGLTFGMHSRIDDRVETVTRRIRAGNVYINRNQIGAVVGSQPFGGEGLSGTGPKAGGPAYLPRFVDPGHVEYAMPDGSPADPAAVQARVATAGRAAEAALATSDLPGPTGESNRLSEYGRGVVLCLGPGLKTATEQARAAASSGCAAVVVAPGATGESAVNGTLAPDGVARIDGISAVALFATDDILRPYRQALADRDGPIVPLLSENDLAARCRLERHVCIDTTASGGNARLLAAAG